MTLYALNTGVLKEVREKPFKLDREMLPVFQQKATILNLYADFIKLGLAYAQ